MSIQKKEHKDKVDWGYISEYQKLSEKFIEEHKDKLDWISISIYQKLSEKFINKHKDKVNWNSISIYQKLSEKFIEEHKDKVDWNSISIYQKLSEKFIEKHKDKVNWNSISIYQKLSEKFIEEHKLKTKDNWNYLSTEEKKKKIVGSNQYKCFKDHFIAYKAVRSDRYSHYNFQYQYLKGKTYESHCDCTSNENSFGLSVWTENEAKNYNSRGIIIKVKVMYSDVGRIVHDNHKIRCKKFEVLS